MASCGSEDPLPPHLCLALLRRSKHDKALLLPRALRIYAHLRRRQRRAPLAGAVAESLVMALASCGALAEAVDAARAFPHRSVFSWTSLISAHVRHGRPEQALALYGSMREHGVEPDRYTFVSLFKACGLVADVEAGRDLHGCARRRGMASDLFVANTLVSMYGKCGDVVEAERVFSAMPRRSAVSWNAMLSALVDRRHGERALQLYRKMLQEEEEGGGEGIIAPDHATSVLSLQACAMLAENGVPAAVALEIGQALHSRIRGRGLQSHGFVASTVASMYAKCGAASEARHAFAALSQHDAVSWNVMLSACLGHGKKQQQQQTLQLYAEMQRRGISPDALSFTVALQACGALAEKKDEKSFLGGGGGGGGGGAGVALELGLALHADAEAFGSASEAFVGNTLLSMYGRCGAIAEAEHVFCRLSYRGDAVPWNAMLSALVEQGQAEKALGLYLQMSREEGGVEPDEVTLVAAARACSVLAEAEEALLEEGRSVKVASLATGRALHAEARRRGLLASEFLASALVTMYGKCGARSEAEHAFAAMRGARDAASWNAMLACYVEQGEARSGLRLYRCMQGEGASPDPVTLVSALQACAVLAEAELLGASKPRPERIALDVGKALHGDAWKKGFAAHAFVASTLVSMYGKCGALREAESVFAELDRGSTVAWNALLAAYVDQGEGAKALKLYRDMRSGGIAGDHVTCLTALQACSCIAAGNAAAALAIGQALCDDALREGLASDVAVSNALISMLGKCGEVRRAKEVFDALAGRCTVVSWNAMLAAYAEQRGGGEAAAAAAAAALGLYDDMRERRVALDHITPLCVLQACSKAGSLEACEQVHFAIAAAGYDFSSALVATLIHAYGSCAAMADGVAFFGSVCAPDAMAWNACICCCGAGGGGGGDSSLHMFEQLKHAGNEPDEVTFVAMISACSHGGLNKAGLECFVAMRSCHGLTPDLKHYGALVDLLGRSGDFRSICNMMQAMMPLEGDEAFWLSVLGACCAHGNAELAARVFFHRAAPSEPKLGGASYVLLSNIYAQQNGNHPIAMRGEES